MICCISFDSYIKPQPTEDGNGSQHVVYLLIPTSNHNLQPCKLILIWLYIFWFLHQTTTISTAVPWVWRLYIFWFLHQTTTTLIAKLLYLCCISFDSYIKPQRRQVSRREKLCCISFDSYIKPQLAETSGFQWRSCISFDSYIKPQPCRYTCISATSCISFDSYIKPQHPVSKAFDFNVVYLLIPTSNHNCVNHHRKISPVVYLLIPTSNHN